MKSKVLVGVAAMVVLVLTFLSGCSTAADNKPVNVNVGGQQTGIWVSGEGKVTVVPDLAIVTLGVSAQTSTVAESQAKASAAMDKVITALKGKGVADKDIQTQNFSISQVTRYDDKTLREVIIGYNVSNTVVAKLRDIPKAGDTIDAVVVAGGDFTRFNGINFSIEKPELYYGKARELAMADAKAKAEQMAKLGGLTLGTATYVSESTYMPPSPGPVPYRADMAASGGGPPTSISAGEMQVILNVQIAYTIK
jgi:uncharacterized protein YggE